MKAKDASHVPDSVLQHPGCLTLRKLWPAKYHTSNERWQFVMGRGLMLLVVLSPGILWGQIYLLVGGLTENILLGACITAIWNRIKCLEFWITHYLPTKAYHLVSCLTSSGSHDMFESEWSVNHLKDHLEVQMQQLGVACEDVFLPSFLGCASFGLYYKCCLLTICTSMWLLCRVTIRLSALKYSGCSLYLRKGKQVERRGIQSLGILSGFLCVFKDSNENVFPKWQLDISSGPK